MEKIQNWTYQYEIAYKKYADFMLRLKQKPSQHGFARFLNVTQTKVRNWEGGACPSAQDLVIIADKLGLSLRWLVTGQGDPEATDPAASPKEPAASPQDIIAPTPPTNAAEPSALALATALTEEILRLNQDLRAKDKEITALRERLAEKD